MELHTENEGLAARNQGSRLKWDFLPDLPIFFFKFKFGLIIILTSHRTRLTAKLRTPKITSLKSEVHFHPCLAAHMTWNEINKKEIKDHQNFCACVVFFLNTDIYKKLLCCRSWGILQLYDSTIKLTLHKGEICQELVFCAQKTLEAASKNDILCAYPNRNHWNVNKYIKSLLHF